MILQLSFCLSCFFSSLGTYCIVFYFLALLCPGRTALLFYRSFEFRTHHLTYAGNDIILLSQIDEANTLSCTAHDTAIGNGKTNHNTTLIDNHEVVIISYVLDSYQTTGLLCNVKSLHTLTATVGYTVIYYVRTLTITLLADNHHGFLLRIIDYNHANQGIITLIETHTANTGRSTSHGTDLILIKTNGTTVSVGKNQLVMTICQTNIYHLITLYDVDSNHTVSTWT